MTAHTTQSKLHRRRFFCDLTGRMLTVAIAAAEASKNDELVNKLLRIKDRLNKRRAKA